MMVSMLSSQPQPGSQSQAPSDPVEQVRADNPNLQKVVSPGLRAILEESPERLLEPGRVLTREEIRQIDAQALQEAQKLTNRYHNAGHIENVVRRTDSLASAAGLPEEERMLMHFAAYFHDAGHCGGTYRQLDLHAERNDLSNEEFSALLADQVLAEHLSPLQRLKVQGMILATTFAQGDLSKLPADHAAELYRPYRPHSPAERLLAFADIMNFPDGIEVFAKENIDLIHESGRAGIQNDFESFVQAKVGFLGFVRAQLNGVAELLPVDTVARLSAQHREVLEQVESSKTSSSAFAVDWRAAFVEARAERLAELDALSGGAK